MLDSLFAQQGYWVEGQRALRGNPRGQQPYEQHYQNNAGQHQRIAGICPIHNGRKHPACQDSEDQSGERTPCQQFKSPSQGCLQHFRAPGAKGYTNPQFLQPPVDR